MTAFVSQENESGSGRQFYCRKEKSLGVLCTNFLRLYNKDGVDSIGLDDAASRLGVERRRIYDVVNILESVGVVARKQKNQYSWKGFEAIPHALEVLKEDALKENFGASTPCIPVKALDENESGGSVSAKTDGQEASSKENKREKSLWLLTQNFVKLFLCSDMDLITLDSAALALLGDSHNSTAMRTKVRRLYDIANVFSSMNLIEKTHHPESRKPAFRWLGWRGKPNNDSVSVAALSLAEPKKRIFGTDVTNIVKRNRVESSFYWKLNQKGTLIRHQDLENEQSDTKLKLQAKPSSKSFEFGPFSPVGLPKIDNSASKRSVSRVTDFENLASTYHPHYRNQALSDLFGHYMEAWKSWYVEFAGRENRQN